ncbi:MAG: YqiA/YcfP family alpha/beta fold hydrolase [bacterium]
MNNARILYLHGLASSPQSLKALYFRERLATVGLDVRVPDLNEGDFRGLTTSRAVDLALREAAELSAPLVIFGSSFGGRVGCLAARKLQERVAGLVLMAPAFSLEGVWRQTLGPDGPQTWRDAGELAVDHPAYEGEVPLGYGFYEDALKTDGVPELRPGLPALVFHGVRDDVVPFADSERFAQSNPGARLVPLNSDHSLNDQHVPMWQEIEPFLENVL